MKVGHLNMFSALNLAHRICPVLELVFTFSSRYDIVEVI